MKKYKVSATMYDYGYFEVEANSEDEAYEKVGDGNEHFIGNDSGCDIGMIEEL